MYKEIEGDLITLTKQGAFDVIAHGCNCFCNMKSGIAPQMDKAFGCGRFPLEREFETQFNEDEQWQVPTNNKGNINKLGQIEYVSMGIKNERVLAAFTIPKAADIKVVTVVNAYTQYIANKDLRPLDYDALSLCMRKMNHVFKGLKIGLPKIGAGLAGGVWSVIREIIQTELKDCDVTVVIYNQ